MTKTFVCTSITVIFFNEAIWYMYMYQPETGTFNLTSLENEEKNIELRKNICKNNVLLKTL